MNIVSVIVDFYNENEISEAKEILLGIADQINPKPEVLKKITKRVGEGKLRRDVEDLLAIYSVLEARKEKIPLFVASDTSRVPASGVFDIVDQINNLKTALETLSLSMIERFDDVRKNLIDEMKMMDGKVQSVNEGVKMVNNELQMMMKTSKSVSQSLDCGELGFSTGYAAINKLKVINTLNNI